jgi:hypothetical protein
MPAPHSVPTQSPVAPPLAAPAGQVEAHDRKVQALEGRLLGREVTAGVHCPAQPGLSRVIRFSDLVLVAG